MSRSDAHSSRLRRRRSRTVPASIVAVVLLAAGVLAVVAAVAAIAAGAWPSQVQSAADVVASWRWNSPEVLTAGIVVAVLGVVLVLAAVLPGPWNAAALSAPQQAQAEVVDVVISNRGLARLALSSAEIVDGVDRVSASAAGHRVRVSVVTSSRDQAQLVRDRVQQVVTDRLRAVGVTPVPRVSTTVSTKEI
jgi:cytoskeletal protein RodZ